MDPWTPTNWSTNSTFTGESGFSCVSLYHILAGNTHIGGPDGGKHDRNRGGANRGSSTVDGQALQMLIHALRSKVCIPIFKGEKKVFLCPFLHLWQKLGRLLQILVRS